MTSYTKQAQQNATIEQASASKVLAAAPSRREFLNYIWAASIVLLIGEASAGLIWFAMPRFKEGSFGSTFTIAPDQIPSPNSSPNSNTVGRFWIAQPQEGLVMLYVVCTHLGCLYKWVGTNNRFECPCHGSKYELDGKYIEGPAPRSLDRFHMIISFADGTTATTNSDGDPIPLDGREITEITVDTGKRILRKGRV